MLCAGLRPDAGRRAGVRFARARTAPLWPAPRPHARAPESAPARLRAHVKASASCPPTPPVYGVAPAVQISTTDLVMLHCRAGCTPLRRRPSLALRLIAVHWHSRPGGLASARVPLIRPSDQRPPVGRYGRRWGAQTCGAVATSRPGSAVCRNSRDQRRCAFCWQRARGDVPAASTGGGGGGGRARGLRCGTRLRRCGHFVFGQVENVFGCSC